ARRTLVPGLRGTWNHCEAQLLRILAEQRRDPVPVGLLVREDVDLLHALCLRELRVGGTLELIVPDHTRVVALAGRVVVVRLARLGAGAADRESWIRIRGADVG